MGPHVADAAEIAVRLTPQGGHDSIDGIDDDGTIRARVAAPPVDDAANAALIRLIAKRIDLPRSAVRIVKGARGRTKRLRIDGLDPSTVHDRLSG